MNELFKAIAENDPTHFRSLLAGNSGHANARNDQGVSATMTSVYYRRAEFTRELIAAGAVLDVFEAAAIGDVPLLQDLVTRNPGDVNRFSPDGFRPLGLAAFFGQTEAALLLMEKGADPHGISRNTQRVAPLHSAASSDAIQVARELIARGADVNARQQSGYIPLHAAVQNGSVEMVRLLLRAGADCSAPNDAGLVPKDVPNRRNVQEVDRLLAACGDRAA